MEREETLRRFDPLRRKLHNYKPVKLTTAELADSSKKESTVKRISNLSIEDVVGASSKLRLTLKETVDNLVGQIDGERLNLEEVKTVKAQLAEKLENARNIRIAADAFEVVKQTGEEKLAALEEEFALRNADAEAERVNTKQAWERAARTQEHHASVEDAARIQANKASEEAYVYQLTRNRQQTIDTYANQRNALERQLAEQADQSEQAFAFREQALEYELEDIKKLSSKIQTLEEKLKTQPDVTRSAAISRVHKAAEQAAKLRAVQQEASKATTAAEIEKIIQQNAKQSKIITDLESKITEASAQNKELATAAMPIAKAS